MKTDTVMDFEIFPWNKNFETGIEEIDTQHQRLVEILNELAHHLSQHSSEFELNKIFDELVDYTEYHFETEESIWSEYFSDDVWFREHEASHEGFVDALIAMKNNQKGRTLDDVIYEIVSFLSKWLAYHILDTDKRMAKVVQALLRGANSMEEAKMIAKEEMSGSTELLVGAVLSMYDNISSRTLDLMREKSLRLQAEEALSQSEERWKFVLEGGVDNVWDWDIKKHKLTHSEDEEQVFHVVDSDLNIYDHSNIYEADKEKLRERFEAHLRGETAFYSCRYRVIRPNGSWSWHQSRGKVVSRDSEGNPLRMIGTQIDITEREMAQQIFENSSQGIMITDINNNIIAVNQAFSHITGYGVKEVIGRNPRFLSSGEHNEVFFANLWKDITVRGQWSGEIVNKKKSGELYTELVMINTIKDAEGKVDHYFAIFDDVTEKKKAEETIVKQAHYDMLTQLPNRHMFHQTLDQKISLHTKLRSSFGLFFIDLDHFKNINDVFGHEVGDAVLVEASKRIQKHLGYNDMVARIGGDEFTVIFCKGVDSIEMELVLQNILDEFHEPFMYSTHQLRISASIGVSIYPHDANNAVDLLSRADQAMYKVKQEGRNSFRYFTSQMQDEATKRRMVIHDLHKALEPKQFEVYYQPLINFKTGEIEKAEALIRWKHPVQGYLSPEAFLDIAEECGLILEIDNWVYQEAMKQTKHWQDRYGKKVQVSVNKSPLQLHTKHSVSEWLEYLDDIELDNSLCMIEITEQVLLEKDVNIERKLMQLREAGVTIALDDFGTGYSSISYLQKFDIDYIKIDKSFVANIETSSQDLALCEAMISMAHKLGIKVIAEGIETEGQKNSLEAMGCEYGQGFYFSRPISAEVFTELICR